MSTNRSGHGRGSPRTTRQQAAAAASMGGDDMSNVMQAELARVSLSSADSEYHNPIQQVVPQQAIVKSSSCIMAPKTAAGTDRQGDTYPVHTNVFPMRMPPNMPVYRYDIEISYYIKHKMIDLSKGPRDEFSRAERRNRCKLLFADLCRIEGDKFGALYEFVYDFAASLFSARDFKLGADKVGSNESMKLWEVEPAMIFTIKREQFSDDCATALGPQATSAIIKIQACKDGAGCITLDDYTLSITPDLAEQDRAFRSFLEMATNQHAINWSTHRAFSGGKLLSLSDSDCSLLGDGKYSASGVDKGVRMIDGPNGIIMPALVIDYLYVHRMHLVDRAVFQIADVTRESADQLTFTWQSNQTISVVEFFRKQYNCELRYPHLPCFVERQSGGRVNYYPIEMCVVADNQPVPRDKQTSQQMQQMLELSAVRPKERYDDILSQLEALNLHNGGRSNRILQSFGIEIDQRPLTITGRQLPFPIPVFGQGKQANVDSKKANWRANKTYVDPAQVDKWAVLIMADDLNRINRQQISNFINNTIGKANGFGIKMAPPVKIQYDQTDDQAMNKYFEQAKANKITFMLYIEDANNSRHDHLKLLELRHTIVTQQVNVHTIVKEKDQIVQNILNKLNVKNSGLNYHIEMSAVAAKRFLLSRGDILIVGYDVCHPDPQPAFERRANIPPTQPSVIGISYNVAKDPEQFVAHYHFQQPRKESLTVSILRDQMMVILRKFVAIRKKPPKRIVLYRDGVSEGQYRMVIDEEARAVRDACQNFHTGYRPTISVVITTKRHNRRFFTATYGNCPPGTIVDNTVTRPDVTDFYLQSHNPIKGTAKFTEYTKLVDENEMSTDEVEALTHALCYMHQIVNSPISLPTPVYVADETAKRGRNIFREFIKCYPESVPYHADNESIDFEALSAMLFDCQMALTKARYNA